jgi:alpha-L-fucosidase 2
MKKVLAFLFLLAILGGCRDKKHTRTEEMFNRDNLVVWCIVPFDAMKRSPEERAVMLDELGLSKLAYDFREDHLPLFEEEIRVLSQHGIELRAVWFWIQGRGDHLLDSTNEFVLSTLERTGTRTELWVSFPEDYFEGGSDSANLATAVRAVREILGRAEASGCSVALYNHGGWFGEPANLVRIIEAIDPGKLRIVYNFHHAHHRIDRFQEDLDLMLPYLSVINLNGMRKEGPKIITLGEGDRELDMLRIIVQSGYAGPLGIIGHTDGEDIRTVLERNLEGLQKLKEQLFPAPGGLELWYDHPARLWEEALPLGNGRMGVMVYGNPGEEHLQFNEESLWDCGPREYQREGAVEYLDTIRQFIFQGRQAEAEELAGRVFMGRRAREESYPGKKQKWLDSLLRLPLAGDGILPGYDDSDWPSMQIEGKSVWENRGLPDMNGSVLFRKKVEIPEEWAGRDLRLVLGNIKDHDLTYVNGVKVGETDVSNTDRTYIVPASVMHAGENLVAVRIQNYVSTGGFNAVREKPYRMHIHPLEGADEPVFLEGDWKYRVVDEHPPFYPQYQADYQPFGDLMLRFPGHEDFSDYRRTLDLSTAIARVSYRAGGNTFRREYFISQPDQAFIAEFSSDRPRRISFSARLSTPHRLHGIERIDDRTIALSLRVEDGEMKGSAWLRIRSEGGTVSVAGDSLLVENADRVILKLVAATNFVNYRDLSADPQSRCRTFLEQSDGKEYAALREAHVKEYRSLFNRFSIDLGGEEKRSLPTDRRLVLNTSDPDRDLVALYVQYSRYLLISSAREGSHPPNLQGIWNNKMEPPWGSKYTTNINCEMNFWGAEPLNLASCHTTLFDMMDELSVEGEKTARAHYGARGWVLHHNTDQWRGTAPINASNHGIWVTGSAWLCHHLWEHFLYGADTAFLRERAYPLIRESARFYMDFLTRDPVTGYLISTPSNSPENGGLVAGPSMDHQLIRSLFRIVLECSRILDTDHELADSIRYSLDRIAPDRIGRLGQLQEWMQDIDRVDNHHRHVSHLWAVYPGAEITWDKDTGLMKAAEQSLLYRGDEGTGWSLAWKISFWARFMDGEHAFKMVSMLLSPALQEGREPTGGSYPNLLDAHPPFQIDGNFGGAAGIIEMLMQSHQGYIQLLPAIPEQWPDGRLTGLRARGGFEIDMEWKDRQITRLKVRSSAGNTLRIRYGGNSIEKPTRKGEILTIVGS